MSGNFIVSHQINIFVTWPTAKFIYDVIQSMTHFNMRKKEKIVILDS